MYELVKTDLDENYLMSLQQVGDITGPPFFQALYRNIGSSMVALQGVDYPANFQDLVAGGDDGGSQTMANLVNQTASRCPASNIVLSGYR